MKKILSFVKMFSKSAVILFVIFLMLSYELFSVQARSLPVGAEVAVLKQYLLGNNVADDSSSYYYGWKKPISSIFRNIFNEIV